MITPVSQFAMCQTVFFVWVSLSKRKAKFPVSENPVYRALPSRQVVVLLGRELANTSHLLATDSFASF
jgi:hypothetical protein